MKGQLEQMQQPPQYPSSYPQPTSPYSQSAPFYPSPTSEVPQYGQQQAQGWSCPQCGNMDRVSKVSVLFEQGFSQSQGVHRPGLFNSGPTYRSTTTTVTGQANKLAPPASSKLPILIAILTFIICCVVGNFPYIGPILSTAVFVGGVVLFILVIKTENAKKRHKTAVWDSLYYCEFHDMVFVPGRPETLTPASRMDDVLSLGLQG